MTQLHVTHAFCLPLSNIATSSQSASANARARWVAGPGGPRPWFAAHRRSQSLDCYLRAIRSMQARVLYQECDCAAPFTTRESAISWSNSSCSCLLAVASYRMLRKGIRCPRCPLRNIESILRRSQTTRIVSLLLSSGRSGKLMLAGTAIYIMQSRQEGRRGHILERWPHEQQRQSRSRRRSIRCARTTRSWSACNRYIDYLWRQCSAYNRIDLWHFSSRQLDHGYLGAVTSRLGLR